MEKAPGFIPRPDIVFSEVSGVNYSVVLKDDAKRIAPFRIWDSRSLDELGNPVIGGLYDRHLGPNGEDDTSVCPTCKLAGMDCPGHCGHIALGLPVYSPLFFDHMFKLIKSICFNCFALKIGHEAAQRFTVRIKLIGENRVPEAMEMSMRDPEKMNRELARLMAEQDGSPPEPLVDVDKELKQTNKPKVRYKAIDSIQKHFMEETVKQIFSDSMKASKCQQCGIACNKIKQLQKVKLFMAPINEGDILQNKRAFIKGYMSYLGRKEYIKESQVRKLEEDMRRAKPAEDEQEKKKKENKDNKMQDSKMDLKLDIKGDIKQEQTAELQENMLAELHEQPDSDFEDVFIDQRMNEYFFVSPLEVEYVIRKCWQTEASGKLLRYIYWSQNTRRRNCTVLDQRNGYQQFFIYNVLVAPNLFRPIQEMDGQKFAHFHNTNLEAIQHCNLEVMSSQKQLSSDFLTDDERLESVMSMIGRWTKLQVAVNQFIDNSTIARPEISGIKQFLEKKEGLFRRNMMGKRVNMAARSTISPDVYIAPGEVGIPPMFAEELSIAEGVTSVNLSHLQHLVQRGPRQYPGAIGVEDQEGNVINLFSTPKTERMSLSKTLLSEASSSKGDGEGRKGPNKAVFRQLIDGDYMLTNRQPTLHKPSLMCHSVRVLRGDRTIRLHYANCGTFNADFDGDEMNLHCPQDHGARAEMRLLMHADHQYIVPTSGGPIRTLIQDHVVSSVWMTSRGRFFDREQIDQLLFFACAPANPKVSLRFELPPPAIIYPKALWTGKQLIAQMVKMMCPGNYPITFMGKAKTSNSFWGEDKWTKDLKWKKTGKKKKKKHAEEVILKAPPPLPGEDKVYFRNGDYLYGTFDKSMYGGFGLVHSAQCIYGNKTAGRLLGACSRLFTHFLQSQGHTTGYQDVILIKKAEDARKNILKRAETVAIEKSSELVEVPFDAEADWDIQLAIKKVVEKKLRDRYLTMPTFPATHDQKISGVMGKISSSVIRECLPDNVQRKFPHNGMAVMTSTGAKGSSVNTSQISCLLGQQELEGRRVPRMASGKTLPCFLPYDAGARSGGFVGDRYLTGLRPQEYYFHCMAGRDGLVDTTVKTASSGYLQRCVIKIQEALYVAYDYTVRDIDDDSIVLLYYGEDAVDVHKQTAIAKLDLVANNAERVAYSVGLDPECQFHDRNVERVSQNLVECDLKAPLPLMANRLPSQIGVVSDKFAKRLYEFVEKELPEIRKNRTKGQDVRKRGTRFDPLSDEGFKQLMYMKYMECLMPPGEAVGVLAGQSIGEPSTQMTLNTFHMAGRGEANVTLGIPRLREILMSATEAIKTPVMKIPLKQDTTDEAAHELYLSMNKSFLVQYVNNCEIKEWPYFDSANTGQCQKFVILVEFFRAEQMVAELNIKWEELIAAFKTFCKVVKKKASLMAEEDSAQITHVDLDGSGFDDLGNMPNEDDGAPSKPKKVKEKDTDDGPMDEVNEEFIEGKMRFCGGHGESVSYAGPDDDDKAFIKLVDQIDKDFDDDDEEDDKNKKKSVRQFAVDEYDEFAVDDSFMAMNDGDFMAALGGKSHVQVADDVSFMEDQIAWTMTATIFIKEPNQVVIEPIIEEALISTVVRQIPRIDKVYISKAEDGKPPAMQSDGINFDAILGLSEIIDENKITCNNMIQMEKRYGIEAAKNTIMNEVSGVFSAYGIDVDPRHLKTISEKMTCQGKVKGCNRMAIAYSISPFLKASFETATKFIIEGALYRACETMGNPAANIVVGRGMKMGTGACKVTVPVPAQCSIPVISAEDREKLGIGPEEDPNAVVDDDDSSVFSDVEKCRAVESDETSSEEDEMDVQINGQQSFERTKQKV